MEILVESYADESNTPTFDRSKEDSKEAPPHRLKEDYRTRKDSQQSGSGSDRNPSRPVANMGNSDGDSSSSSDSSDEGVKNPGPVAQSSGSSRSTGSTSGSDSEKSNASKKSEHEELTLTGKDKKSSPKVSSRRRSPSPSGSKSRRRRQSSDGRHRRSRSRDHRHKSSRSERKHSRRSRSRSRSRDRHGRPHSRRHRDGHRRRHRSSSRDGHRHRKPSSPRRRHRSPDHRKNHREEKRRRSRSPLLGAKPGAAGVSTSTITPGNSKPPVYKVAGVKFNRGRGIGTAGSFKDIVKNEYIQRLQNAEDVVAGKSQLVTTAGPSQVTSRVATVSAGTGVMGPGGLNQVLVNQMQMHLQQTQQYMTGQPGCLTPLQKEINQKYILHTTGRTREQVEAEYGVKIPDIYNETTNNLAELAQRKKKRDMLWKGSEKKTTVNSTFNAVPILPGQSQTEKEKFLRLMGCKKGMSKEETDTIEDASIKAAEQTMLNSQIRNEELEREYESSRRHTHISRGCGLGYSTTMYQPH